MPETQIISQKKYIEAIQEKDVSRAILITYDTKGHIRLMYDNVLPSHLKEIAFHLKKESLKNELKHMEENKPDESNEVR